MSVGFRDLSGLDNTRVSHGLSVSEIPGDGGAGPLGFTIIISASGLDPGTGSIALASPTTIPKSSSGADENGNISVQVTWFNNGDDINFSQAGGGIGTFNSGFWAEPFLIRGSVVPSDKPMAIDIQFSPEPVIDYTHDLNNFPDNTHHLDPNWNGDQGDVELDFDITSSESPDSIAIVRDGVVIANVPYTGDGSYSYTDIVFAPGDYEYSFFAYKYPDSRSESTAPFSVTFGGAASITMTMSGGITFGGSAIIAFLGNPTGTYTIVKDKTNDTLYNTDDDVAIPNPFIITGFLPQ